MSQQKGISFKEFRQRFQIEEACEAYLFEQRWPDGFVCPKWNHSDALGSFRAALQGEYIHHYQVFDKDSGALRWIHILISNAKSFLLGTYHGIGKKHLQCYFDEFAFRFSTQNGRMRRAASTRRTLRICKAASMRFGNCPDSPCPSCQYPLNSMGFKSSAKGRGAIHALYIPGIPAKWTVGAVNCTQKAGKDGTRYEASETPFEIAGAPPDAGSLHAPYCRQAGV